MKKRLTKEDKTLRSWAIHYILRGADIFHHPIFHPKIKNWLHQFRSKVLNTIFIGYTLNAGGGWTGDQPVADAEEMKNNAASAVHVERFRVEELGKWENKSYFPVQSSKGRPLLDYSTIS